MAQQKFFSGLTEGMMNKGMVDRPDRQKTHFYWPDDSTVEPSESLKKQPSVEALLAGNGNLPSTINRQANEANDHNNDQCRQQHYMRNINDQASPYHHSQRPTRSNIQIYNDVESIGKPIGKQQRLGINENLRIDQPLRRQPSERETGEAARSKRLSAMQSKIEFYDYIDTTTSTPSHHRSKRPSEKQSFAKTENGWVTTATVLQDGMTDPYPTIDSYSQRSQPSSMHGGDDLEDDQSSSRSSELNDWYSRTSPSTALPEHKRHSQRHLRSSINFHNGCTTADDSGATRKPLTVRDSATTRVGVGLPNL
ncbi:uncharacterized protein LOC126579563 isoform X2 [Anopheles aquasalis]|nr:uncharacterized protein LOC126579563 isoform X2 [Anopheles aquasalis]